MDHAHSSQKSHIECLEMALDFFKNHNLEPFHIIDIQPFYDNDKEENDIICLCFYNIFGDFTNINEKVEKDLVPYLCLASGHLIKTYGGMFSLDDKSFYRLYERKIEERKTWLATQTISLDKIDKMAHEHLDYSQQVDFYNEIERDKKHKLKYYKKNRHIERWGPYVTRVLERDPPRPRYRVVEAVTSYTARGEKEHHPHTSSC